MMLPCRHRISVVEQVQPTIDLLSNFDILHPEILQQHQIHPDDYNGSLVFRSAVESIRGSFVASSTTQREGYVRQVLSRLKECALIDNYRQSSSSERYDFVITVEHSGALSYFAALEVKGGEGNSINISERPAMAHEFGVWCHLDGAIKNHPSQGAHSIINRLTNEMVRRGKHVDMLFFKDILCGSNIRICPKYVDALTNSLIAPDIVLFPQDVPTQDNPEPPVHTIDTLRLPGLILRSFNVPESEWDHHLWYVDIRLIGPEDGRWYRGVTITHQGSVVDESRSRSWRG